jgi:hypothetical protein
MSMGLSNSATHLGFMILCKLSCIMYQQAYGGKPNVNKNV